MAALVAEDLHHLLATASLDVEHLLGLQDILATEPDYIARIGLAKHLSPTRSNGLASLLAFIREHARAALKA